VYSSVPSVERRVRICRPAFQDFHYLLRRLSARAELRRQVTKLRWWNPANPLVLDVLWEPIPDTDLGILFLDDGYGYASGLKVVFFDFLAANPDDNAIWVLALMRQDELFTPITETILLGRRSVVVERAPSFDIEDI
jgi:hypothetical protein